MIFLGFCRLNHPTLTQKYFGQSFANAYSLRTCARPLYKPSKSDTLHFVYAFNIHSVKIEVIILWERVIFGGPKLRVIKASKYSGIFDDLPRRRISMNKIEHHTSHILLFLFHLPVSKYNSSMSERKMQKWKLLQVSLFHQIYNPPLNFLSTASCRVIAW